MIVIQLQFISAIIILASSAVPIYLTIKLKDNLKKLTLILTVFILIHAVYHVFGFLGYSLLAEGVFQPLSVMALIFFGIVYSGFTKPKNVGTRNMVMALNSGIFLLFMNNITIILLLIALGIFVWQVSRSKSIRSFQFQISIFLVVWILGEIVGNLEDNGIIVFPALQGNIGLEIHVVSMVLFGLMLWLRFYYSERNGKKMIEDEDAKLI
ncbi:MAG: hypothetical protein M3P08_03200 [Thermoproteota archaeon]|jgi:CBS-domain-containing membrane protein|nr:hypothetical protein [Thermoproteota archaeon]